MARGRIVSYGGAAGGDRPEGDSESHGGVAGDPPGRAIPEWCVVCESASRLRFRDHRWWVNVGGRWQHVSRRRIAESFFRRKRVFREALPAPKPGTRIAPDRSGLALTPDGRIVAWPLLPSSAVVGYGPPIRASYVIAPPGDADPEEGVT